MAALANTYMTTQAVGNREELSDVVSRITPEDTPIYSLIEKGRCVSIHPEWETDELAAPGENIKSEGDEYAFGAITPPERLGNYTQIKAMGNPWLSPEERAVLHRLYEQQVQAAEARQQQELWMERQRYEQGVRYSDPAYQLGLEKSRIGIEQMRSPRRE